MNKDLFRLSFNTIFRILVINFALFGSIIAMFINLGSNNQYFILFCILIFVINSFIIFFFIKWIIKRISFNKHNIKEGYNPLDILTQISHSVDIPLKKIDQNIYHLSYLEKKIFFKDHLIKDVIFIITEKNIFLNICYREETVFIYNSDPIERKIKEILSKYILKEID